MGNDVRGREIRFLLLIWKRNDRNLKCALKHSVRTIISFLHISCRGPRCNDRQFTFFSDQIKSPIISTLKNRTFANNGRIHHIPQTPLHLDGGLDHLFSKFYTRKVSKIWFYYHLQIFKRYEFSQNLEGVVQNLSLLCPFQF